MSYLDVLLGGYKTIQNNGSNVAAEPTLNIVGATSIVDDSANKRTTVTLGTGITQLSGDVTAGPGSGSVTATAVKANGASVPAAGSLTTGNVLQVSGPSALSYGPVNLAGGSNYISGTLPAGNVGGPAGEVTGTQSATVVSGPFSTSSWSWVASASPTLTQAISTGVSGANFAITPQAPKVGGGGTAGDLTINTPASDGAGSKEGGLLISYGGTAQVRAGVHANGATYAAIWFKDAGSPTIANASYFGTGVDTWVNAPSGNVILGRAASAGASLALVSSRFYFGGSPAANDPLIIDWSTTTTPFIQSGTAATQLSVGTNKSGAAMVLQADAATTIQTLASTGTELANLSTPTAGTGPRMVGGSGRLVIVDSDGTTRTF